MIASSPRLAGMPAEAAKDMALAVPAPGLRPVGAEPAAQSQAKPLVPSAEECARLQRERDYAVRWANQSVEMLQEAFFPVADALRNLEAYLRNTPHHNAIEAAAARKALAKFDEVQS